MYVIDYAVTYHGGHRCLQPSLTLGKSSCQQDETLTASQGLVGKSSATRREEQEDRKTVLHLEGDLQKALLVAQSLGDDDS